MHKINLSFKIFMSTFTILILVSLIIIACISFVLPPAFVEQVNTYEKEEVERFIKKLEKTTLDDCAKLMIDFQNEMGVKLYVIDYRNQIIYFNDDLTYGYRNPITLSSSIHTDEENETIDFTIPENNDVALKTEKLDYKFYFSDESSPYDLIVKAAPIRVSQLEFAIQKIAFPLFVCLIAITAIVSFFYSKYIIKIKTVSINLENDIKRVKELNEQRTLLFLGVSHELKTPIFVIKGQIESMISNIGKYRDRDKYLKRCLEVTEILEKKVNDVIAISKMNSTDFVVNKTHFKLSEIIRQSFIEHIELIEKKAMQYTLDLDDSIILSADRQLIGRALNNIISNACNYSPENAEIAISNKNGKLTIFNSNTSIEEEELEHICKPFYRADKSRKYSTGTGLGLYFVSEVLKMHKLPFQIKNENGGVLFSILL